MADWYISSVAYNAIPAWAASTTYAVGAIRRQLAPPAINNERCFRVSAITTGISGATEPAWVLTNNSTTTDGGVTWTECSGQNNHQHDNGVTNTWTAPAKTIRCLENKGVANGDRIFFSSDHAELTAGNLTILTGGNLTSPMQCISVNRTGSVPPTATDYLPGASIAAGQAGVANTITLNGIDQWSGFTFVGASGFTGASTVAVISVGANSSFKDCSFQIGSTTSSNRIQFGLGSGHFVLENTTFQFGNIGQYIQLANNDRIVWRNTPSAILGTIPTQLLVTNSGTGPNVELNGIDLSAVNTNITLTGWGTLSLIVRLTGCRLNAGVTIAPAGLGNLQNGQRVEVINCDSGLGVARNELYTPQGTVTTEATIVMTGGSTDGTTRFSHKYVSSAVAKNSPLIAPFEGFPIVVWNDAVGTSKTLTIELLTDGVTLTNADMWARLGYLGNASYPLFSYGTNYLATPLTAAANIATSTATWVTTGISTPVAQHIQVTFTPQLAGWLVITLYLGRASTTVYVDQKPVII
jgi:hypothetical protein